VAISVAQAAEIANFVVKELQSSTAGETNRGQRCTQQKLRQFPNVFRFAHSMCTHQYTNIVKLAV